MQLYHFPIQFRRRFGDQFLRALDQTFDEGVDLAALVEQGQCPVQVEERVRGVVFQHVRVQERRAETQVDVGDGIAMVVVGHADVHRRKIQVDGMLFILLDVIAVLVHIAQLVHAVRVLEQERTQRPVLIRLPVIHLLVPAVVVAVAQVADGLTVARRASPVSAKKLTNERASFWWDCRGLDKFIIREIPLQKVNWKGTFFVFWEKTFG